VCPWTGSLLVGLSALGLLCGLASQAAAADPDGFFFLETFQSSSPLERWVFSKREKYADQPVAVTPANITGFEVCSHAFVSMEGFVSVLKGMIMLIMIPRTVVIIVSRTIIISISLIPCPHSWGLWSRGTGGEDADPGEVVQALRRGGAVRDAHRQHGQGAGGAGTTGRSSFPLMMMMMMGRWRGRVRGYPTVLYLGGCVGGRRRPSHTRLSSLAVQGFLSHWGGQKRQRWKERSLLGLKTEVVVVLWCSTR
jgi:hypothetical protein